jgi:cytochrome P450
MNHAERSRVFDLTAVTTSPALGAEYAKLREAGGAVLAGKPIADTEYLAVLGYDLVRKCALDSERLSSALGMTIPPLKSPIPLIPVEVDPPAHSKYHKLLVPYFRRERIADWADMIRAVVDEELDTVIEAGKCDLSFIGHRVPPRIIAAILGVPDDGPRMVELTQRLDHAASAGNQEETAAANRDMFAYVDGIVTAAEGSDREDLTGAVANAVVDGEPIGHLKAVGTIITIVIAGQETTVNGISSLVALLGAQHEVRRRLAADPSLIPAAVEEVLRMQAPVQMIARTAAKDTEVAGCPVHRGDKVGFVLGAANYDPARFEDPDTFRLDRGGNPHVAFGHGIHRCLGEHLARAEMTIVAEQLIAGIPDYQVDGEVMWGADTPFNRGTHTIPVRFTPGLRATAREIVLDVGVTKF